MGRVVGQVEAHEGEAVRRAACACQAHHPVCLRIQPCVAFELRGARDGFEGAVGLLLTGTATSSAQIYYESMHSGRWPAPSTVPTGVVVFAEDVAIRRLAEPLNTIVHWSDINEGGHFASMERPALLAADLRSFATMLATRCPASGAPLSAR